MTPLSGECLPGPTQPTTRETTGMEDQYRTRESINLASIKRGHQSKHRQIGSRYRQWTTVKTTEVPPWVKVPKRRAKNKVARVSRKANR